VLDLLGALSRSRHDVDGLRFDASGNPTDSNPETTHTPAEVFAFPLANTAQARNVRQSWKATPEQIDDGAMDGFVRFLTTTSVGVTISPTCQ
jgi:hypothetical protein